MAFLHRTSAESLKSELDLWTVPPTQTAVESGQWNVFKPLASLDNATTVDFVVPGTGNEYLDLAHTLLYVKCKIVKNDGKGLKHSADGRDVGPINYLHGSLWSQVDVSLNQKVISQSAMTYPYRAYLESLLGYSSEAKCSHMTARMWYDDTAGAMDDLAPKKNKGLDSRRTITDDSHEFEMIGPIHADIFNQEKFLLNNTELRIKLTRNKDAFLLMSSKEDEKLQITDASLYVRKVRLSPSVLLAHSKALDTAPAKYPITRADLKTVTISSGLQSKSIDNLHMGPLPSRLVIGLVTNEAFNGHLKSNPFNFKHMGVNYLSVFVDGQQYPAQPLTPNYDKKLFLESFYTLFTGTGVHFKDTGFAIDRDEYPAGYTLYCLDLTQDLSASEGHWNLQKQGTVRLEVRFDKALTEAVTAIIYSEFNNLIEIDKNRSVVTDYTT